MKRQPTCKWCRGPIAWFRSPTNGKLRPFEAKPIPNSRDRQGVIAYPIEGNRAWRYRDLVEDLMVRHESSEQAAEDEAHAMPWHTFHDCPSDPYKALQNSGDPR